MEAPGHSVRTSRSGSCRVSNWFGRHDKTVGSPNADKLPTKQCDISKPFGVEQSIERDVLHGKSFSETWPSCHSVQKLIGQGTAASPFRSLARGIDVAVSFPASRYGGSAFWRAARVHCSLRTDVPSSFRGLSSVEGQAESIRRTPARLGPSHKRAFEID